MKKTLPILALTLLLLITGCNNKEETTRAIEVKSDIYGTWYSDNPRRIDPDQLTINKDGSFSSWFTNGAGTYEYNKKNNEILFTFGNETKTMKVASDGNLLTYDNGPLSHNYYEDENIAKKEMTNRKQDIINSVTEQLLGSWKGTDPDFDSIYTFYEDGVYENNVDYLGDSYILKNKDLSTKGTYTVEEYKGTTNTSPATIVFNLDDGRIHYKSVSFFMEDNILKLRLDNDVYTK